VAAGAGSPALGEERSLSPASLRVPAKALAVAVVGGVVLLPLDLIVNMAVKPQAEW
jgi:hypothetical protein